MPQKRDSLPGRLAMGARLLPEGGRISHRALTLFVALLAFIFVAGGLYITQASLAASFASEVRDLETKREWLRWEILTLRADLARQASLRRCLAVGEAAGYRLPDVADSRRRLRIVVPLPQDANASAGVLPMVEGEGVPGVSQQSTGGGIVDRLLRQFEQWLVAESATPERPR